MQKKLVIIDYGLGNLFSVKHAFKYLGFDSEITSDKNIVSRADALILPGVGAFGEAIENLRKFDLISPMIDSINSGKPFLGVCLGMQLLFEESEEFGIHKGLGVIPGSINKFPTVSKSGEKIRVPQIGWNQIKSPSIGIRAWEKTPFNSIKEGEYMYFVHSYFAKPSSAEFVLSETTYEDTTYCSSVLKDNVLACQFHPEKSASRGIKIYENWSKAIV